MYAAPGEIVQPVVVASPAARPDPCAYRRPKISTGKDLIAALDQAEAALRKCAKGK